jgi:hypothetical protein
MKKLATLTLAVALFALPVIGSARGCGPVCAPAPVCQPVCRPACAPACQTCFNPIGFVGGVISGVGNAISGIGNCFTACW